MRATNWHETQAPKIEHKQNPWVLTPNHPCVNVSHRAALKDAKNSKFAVKKNSNLSENLQPHLHFQHGRKHPGIFRHPPNVHFFGEHRSVVIFILHLDEDLGCVT